MPILPPRSPRLFGFWAGASQALLCRGLGRYRPRLGVETTSREFGEISGLFFGFPAFPWKPSFSYFGGALQLEVASGLRREFPSG